jgi:hypothetical protein
MPSPLGHTSGVYLTIGTCLAFIAAPASAQTVAATDDQLTGYLRDSAQVASVACELAGSTRPKEVRTRCHVLTFRETAREFVVRVRETPVADDTIEFPLSEVRLHKDRRGAVLTRMPER